jgi:hypothetical protein
MAAYEVVTVTDGGAIEGSVVLTGTPPPEVTVKVTKNQDYCGLTIVNPIYVVGGGGGLGNVVVYLSDITRGKARPAEPLALVNEHCMFTPRAQGAMVGGSVKTSNNDMLLHNTHPRIAATNATVYNVALPFKGFSVTKPLPSKPDLISVRCDAHEWMRAWILELESPYYTTTDTEGHFSIRDIPPGRYALVAWHEAAGERSEQVVVEAGRTAQAKMMFAANK